jgi:predicted RNA-binding protein YlxR (DUF448 family)
MPVTQSHTKHIPERTCIVCRQKRPKWELVRIVRTPQGALEIDNRGKKAGRGAYLCRTQDCFESGLKRKKLEYALKVEIGPEQRTQLLEYCKTLLMGGSSVERRSDLISKGLVNEA